MLAKNAATFLTIIRNKKKPPGSSMTISSAGSGYISAFACVLTNSGIFVLVVIAAGLLGAIGLKYSPSCQRTFNWQEESAGRDSESQIDNLFTAQLHAYCLYGVCTTLIE